MTGVCLFFNSDKGWGFIQDDEDPNRHYFTHYSKTFDRIVKDDKVEFELIETPRGLNAIDVKRIKI